MSLSEKAASSASVRVQPATPPAPPSATNASLKALASPNAKSSSATAASATPPIAISKAAKLQTYLPTGTWITFTALQTLAFSLSPNVAPNGSRNCNTSQLLALSVFVGLSGLWAFVAPFIKNFVLDANGAIAYPAPSGASVANRVRDNVTGATFPYRTPEGHYVWPLVQDGEKNDWVRDGQYIGVVVFDKKFTFQTADDTLLRRLFRRTSTTVVDLVPRADNDAPSNTGSIPPRDNTIDAEIQDHVPALQPHWGWVLNQQQQYLAFNRQTLLHAFVSVCAFAALSLMNTQVSGCFYPGLADWVPVVVQVLTLVVVSGVAAFIVTDPAEATLPPPTIPTPSPSTVQAFSSGGNADLPNVVATIPTALQPFTANIPASLQSLVVMVIWVRSGSAAAASTQTSLANEGKTLTVPAQAQAPIAPSSARGRPS